MGPFYCPRPNRLYGYEFFCELKVIYAKATEFTVAYVMAHEIGHHIQNIV